MAAAKDFRLYMAARLFSFYMMCNLMRCEHQTSFVWQEPPSRGGGHTKKNLNARLVEEEPQDPVQKWTDGVERGDWAELCSTSPGVIPDPATAKEATALLARFNPGRSSPAALARLLERRADPNLQPGDFLNADEKKRFETVSPLWNVLHSAKEEDLTPMRGLLLDYGATNTSEHDRYWKWKVSLYKHDKAWVRQIHEDPRGEYQDHSVF